MHVTAVVVGGVAVLALAACTTAAEPEPEHLEVSSVDDLVRGCDDILDGYPGAAEYTGAGPHPLVVFARNYASDVDLGDATKRPEFELANSTFSDSVLAKPVSPRDVQLLACGNAVPGATRLNVCSYSSVLSPGGTPTQMPLYSQLYTYTVYALRTGRVVDTLRVESGMAQPLSSCPTTIESGATRVFAKAQPYELNDLFDDLVTGSA
jgi:hypothetical protein